MDKRISRKEYMKDYQKLWYLKHKEEIAKKHKEQQPILRLSKQEYRDNHPWLITYDNILQRCTNPNNKSYNVYKYRRGDITKEQLRELWFECKAYLMDKPSIDRIDPNGVYTKANLQYIEWNEHLIKTHHERKLKKLGVLK
jgi:hypothetical protein